LIGKIDFQDFFTGHL